MLRRQLPGHSRPPPAKGDLRRIKQQPGETLQKYIQCFNSVRLKIPKVTDEAIISAFSDGVRDVKMKEELAIHEELCMTLELFNLATKCARAEEGRFSVLELPTADPEEKKAKAKDVKRKGVAVLVAEPEMKRDRDHPESSRSSHPFCAFHNVHNHNTSDCQELTAIQDGRFGRCPERNDRATAKEDVVADAGMTVARARSGATSLVRTAGRIILARAPGETSLVRIALRATPVFPRCRHRQEGMTTTIKTRGLGASRSRALSPASWAELRPQPLSVPSSSLLAK